MKNKNDLTMKMILDKLDKMDSKLDKLDERVDRIDVTLASQAEILEDHTRRSLANEKIADTLAAELKPVVLHVAHVNGVVKFLALLSLIAGLAVTVLKLFGKI